MNGLWTSLTPPLLLSHNQNLLVNENSSDSIVHSLLLDLEIERTILFWTRAQYNHQRFWQFTSVICVYRRLPIGLRINKTPKRMNLNQLIYWTSKKQQRIKMINPKMNSILCTILLFISINIPSVHLVSEILIVVLILVLEYFFCAEFWIFVVWSETKMWLCC